ncbi:MAG: DUF4105 domain-containing protein [Pseudomonadales bacterium]|nr:DUF4105 domain-containing protein [Pseudomonadales bacterium]
MTRIWNANNNSNRPGKRAILSPLCLLTLCLSLLGGLHSSQAQAQAQLEPLVAADYPVPQDMSAVHFYLITVDVGDQVWDNFGHTALRVIDENSNTDLVFNWGLFDVSGGVVAFSWNFFKGIMEYQLGTNTPANEFAMYRDQQRSVWQDKINLTNPEKEILYRRLMWNLEPENRVYDYQYFFDNCTTRVRDYLDEALDGRIRSQLDGMTEQTFREQVRAHYESVAVIRFSLDILMNSNIDRRVSEWEAMFLPLQFRESLSGIRSDVAVGGQRQMLLSDHQQIMEFAPPRVEQDAYQIASVMLLAPVLFLMLMLKRIPMSYFATHSRVGLKMAGLSYRLLGLLGLLTALFSGIYGCLMLGSWFVSEHLDLHHNINLLLFWPTDILGLVVAMRWLLLRRAWPLTHNTAPFMNYYLLAHVLCMLAYAVIALGGLVEQDISLVATYVLPGYLLFTLLIWVVGFEPAKPKNMFF